MENQEYKRLEDILMKKSELFPGPVHFPAEDLTCNSFPS